MSENPQALGQRLKAERERRGMSTQKIANGMHLDEWVIDALEAGEYERIGPAVYARGHLKKYASLLGLSPAPAPAPAGGEAKPSDSRPSGSLYPPPIVRLDTPKESQAPWPAIGAVAAFAALAGGAFWWHQAHERAAVPGLVRPASPPIAEITPAPPPPAAAAGARRPQEGAPSSGTPLAEAESTSSAAPAVAAPSPAAGPPAAVSPAAMPPKSAGTGGADLTPGVGRAHLRLSFSADSWVEIEDYSGRRIYTGNGRANSVKTVSGVAPFRVFLRSASGVQLELNDRAVAIGRQFISGNEARFEAGADGVLRRDTHLAAPPRGAQTAAVSPHG